MQERVNNEYIEANRSLCKEDIKYKKDLKDWGNWLTGNNLDRSLRPFFRGRLTGEAEDFAYSVLPNHYRYEDKIALMDIDFLSIQADEGYGKYNNLCINTTDGVTHYISLNKCLEGSTKKQALLQAMRGTVRLHHGCGNSEFHLDHAGEYPFIRIANMYLEGKDEAELLAQRKTTNEHGFHLIYFDNGFIEFHDKYARLELITKEANLAKAHEAKQWN